MSNMDTDLAATWNSYKRTGDMECRNQLVLHYSSLVRYVAAKVGGTLPSTVDREDLISYGMFGLIDAIAKFDPDKGVPFESYASIRIKGAIFDEMRSLDWVSRGARSKARDVEKARAEVEALSGRPAEHSEVAQFLGLTLTEYWSLVNTPSSTHIPIEDFGEEGHGSYAIDLTSNPSDLVEAGEVIGLVSEAVNNMDERSKTILVLYYLHGRTLGEIGRILGVTESRVCQLQSKALQGLSSTLGQGGLAVA